MGVAGAGKPSWSEFLAKTDRKPQTVRDVFEFLAEHDRPGTVNLAILMLKKAPKLESSSTRAAVASCLFRLPSELWERLWPIVLRSSAVEATNLWTENIQIYDLGSRELLEDFSECQLLDLHLFLRRLFPPQNDPRLESGFVTRQQMCIDLRNDCRKELVRRGASNEIQGIIDAVSPEERSRERWHLLDAEQTRQAREWHPVDLADLVLLTHSRDARFVRDADDLTEILMSTLADWEHDLQARHIGRLWNWSRENGRKTDFRPKEEETLTHELEDWLRVRLKNVVNVDREVQIDRLNHRVDLKIQATPRHEPENPLTVIIELKRAHHPKVATAMEEQLVGDYLQPNPEWNNGIYLVAWYNCKVWERKSGNIRLKSKTIKGARRELESGAARLSLKSCQNVRSIVVDCRIDSGQS